MVVVFGTSGHAKEIAAILNSTEIAIDYFVSNHDKNLFIGQVPVISEEIFFASLDFKHTRVDAFIAIGSSSIRQKIVEKSIASTLDIVFPNLYHPSTIQLLRHSIQIGSGNVFFPGVILTAHITIGSHNHFNLSSCISHDCMIGDYNTLSPGVKIAGNVKIGNSNFFGISSSVIDNITIESDIIIGAGATLVSNTKGSGTYVGIPAAKLK